MADDKDNSADKEKWSDPAESNATFAPTDVDTTNLNDYDEWAKETGGWRKLLAAVRGGSAMATDDGRARAAQLVDPRTLMTSGAAFQVSYDTLSWLEAFLRDHPKAIAGPKRPWQGPAADAFLAKMEYLADWVGAEAERIAGADGTGGANSVPNQLNYSGNYLAWAQEAMNYYDTAWAKAAREGGNAVGDDGLVAITGSKYERPMTQQMHQVVSGLAAQYNFTYDKVTPPTGNGEPPITTPNLGNLTPPPGGAPP
ncbi:hypothetical protein ABZS42_03995, partial [Micromonospora sp. NPDC005367]